MDQRTKLIAVGSITFFIVVIIFGVIIYTGKLSKKDINPGSGLVNNPLSNLPVASSSGAISSTVKPVNNSGNSDKKYYQGENFNLNFPKTWGLLTCVNSQNFEFDPTNNTDIKNVVCDRAVKPVTVLITNRLNCRGEVIKIGEKQVTKFKEVNGGDTNYRWCVQVGNRGFDFTHRVSLSGSRATSSQDFSAEVEQIIATIKN